jgi:hypothetical protein
MTTRRGHKQFRPRPVTPETTPRRLRCCTHAARLRRPNHAPRLPLTNGTADKLQFPKPELARCRVPFLHKILPNLDPYNLRGPRALPQKRAQAQRSSTPSRPHVRHLHRPRWIPIPVLEQMSKDLHKTLHLTQFSGHSRTRGTLRICDPQPLKKGALGPAHPGKRFACHGQGPAPARRRGVRRARSACPSVHAETESRPLW